MIKVNGVSQLTRHLLSLTPKLRAALEEETIDTAIAARNDAQNRAPVETGELRSSIRFELTNKGLGFVLIADAEYWAYVEFGTGGSTDIPAGYEALAARYRGKDLKTVNIPAQPFLIPAFVAHSDLYLKNVKRLINRVLR